MNSGFVPESPDLPALNTLGQVAPESIVSDAFIENAMLTTDVSIKDGARRVAFHGVRAGGGAFAGSALPGLRLTDCVFDQADMSGSTWIDARIVRTVFEGCKQTGFDARGAELRDVVFRECKAPACNLSETSIKRVVFENCRVTDLDLSGSRIESLRCRGCDLRNLRLTGAKIELLDLRGCEVLGIAIQPAAMGGVVIETTQSPAIAAAAGVRVMDDWL